MPASLAARVGVEMLGSLMTMCLAVGSVANALLPRTKGEGMGLLPIALSVGLGIGLPIGIFFRTSAFFNPGILMAVTVRGGVPAGDFFALLAAEVVGYLAGAVVLWAFYLPHLNAAVQLPPADEIDRLLCDPAVLNDTALMNASYTLQAPHVTSQQSFWRFALQDLKAELGRAYAARKVADPFRTCPEELANACDTAGASLSRRGSHAQLQQLGSLPATQPPQPQQAWGSGPAPQAGMHAAAAAEEGGFKQPGGGLSPAASEDEAGLHSHATARTFAERMRADAGPLRSRGHLAAALCKARQDVLLSVFVTRPAVWSPVLNFVQEFVAMTIMATAALLLFESSRFQGRDTGGLWPTQLGLLIGLLNTAMILSLGGATGPAINPARDLGPRLAFHILPIPGKGCSEWHYAWVPFFGGMAGGAAAGGHRHFVPAGRAMAIVISMALRQALSTLGRRGLAACGTLRLAPLAAASNAAATGWAPGSAASLLSRGISAEAVADREKKLPETSGWGSTLVGHLLKAKAEDSGAWLWCAADDMVIDAVRKMTHANVGSLLVFDPSKLHLVKCGVDQVCNASKDAVVGIITERDYLNKVVVKGKQSSSTKVSDIMTPSEVLLTVTPQHSVLDVMELMVDKNVRHLPVIDEGNMVGMISIKDVVHVMLKEHREEVARMEEYIQGTY